MKEGQSSQKRPLDRDSVLEELALDWARASKGRKGAFQDAIGAKCHKTVGQAISGETLPELHTVLNSLLLDETALFGTLLRFGGVFVRTHAGTCDDNAAISAMLRAATEYFERMKDGVRDHQDTLALADLFRPLIPAMLCVVREADEMRGRS